MSAAKCIRDRSLPEAVDGCLGTEPRAEARRADMGGGLSHGAGAMAEVPYHLDSSSLAPVMTELPRRN